MGTSRVIDSKDSGWQFSWGILKWRMYRKVRRFLVGLVGMSPDAPAFKIVVFFFFFFSND